MRHATRLRRSTGWITTLVAAAALLVAPPAQAQTQVDETRPAATDVRIEISDIVVGSIRVVAWDREEIRVTGRLGADVDSLVIEGDRSSYEIEAEWDDRDWDWDWDEEHDDERDRDRDRERERDRHRNRHGEQHRDLDVELEISAPRGARLQIEGVTVGVEIDSIEGDIDVETVTGGIDYRGAARRLSLATVTGGVRVTSPQAERIDVETVQGAIEFTGGFAAGARASFEAVGGSIVLRVPGDTAATFDVETLNGRIENDFGQEPVRESRWIPSSELRFTLGGGGARVSVETLQGSIEIRRQ